MTKTAEEIRDQELELIRQVLDFDVRRRDLDCNEKAMLDALKGQPMNLDTVCAVYERIKLQLANNPLWEEAVAELRQAHPEWQYTQALFGILADEWSHPELRKFDVSADGLIKLAETLNKKQPFAFTDAYSAQQAEVALRARLIQEVSQGRTDFYEARDGGNSYIQKFRVDELPTLTTERLQEVRDLVAGQRELEGMDSKKWLADQRAAGIRRAQERLGMKNLPAQWKLTQDGDDSRTGIDMKAGMLVPPTGENIRRMHRVDIFALTKAYGADAVNAALRK
jgi:hypothetical protein